MKINSKTRIRVLTKKACSEFKIPIWDRWSLIEKLTKEYDFTYTSRRWNIIYFQPKDINKATLFMLKYGECVK